MSIDKTTFPDIAREIAERMAVRMVEAYTTAVSHFLEGYDEPPDEDDFWAWLEGYGWEDPSAEEIEEGEEEEDGDEDGDEEQS